MQDERQADAGIVIRGGKGSPIIAVAQCRALTCRFDERNVVVRDILCRAGRPIHRGAAGARILVLFHINLDIFFAQIRPRSDNGQRYASNIIRLAGDGCARGKSELKVIFYVLIQGPSGPRCSCWRCRPPGLRAPASRRRPRR